MVRFSDPNLADFGSDLEASIGLEQVRKSIDYSYVGRWARGSWQW